MTLLFLSFVACGGSSAESGAALQPTAGESEGEWKVSSGRSVVTLEDEKGGERASSSTADVHFGDLQVNGGHVEALVKKSLIRERFAFEPCYSDNEAGKSGKAVTLSIDMFVHEDGHVSEPKVTGDEEVSECVAERLAESEAMPNGPERTRVRFRVLLQPKSELSDEAAAHALKEPF